MNIRKIQKPRLAEIGLAPLCDSCEGQGEIEVDDARGNYVLIKCPFCSGLGRAETKRRW